MTSDYSEAAKSLITLNFPKAKALSNGTWVERWRIEVEVDTCWEPEALAAAEREMAQPEFTVKIEPVSQRGVELVVTMESDARQGRFLAAIYAALLVFDRRVARVAAVEGQPRAIWSAFRSFDAIQSGE